MLVADSPVSLRSGHLLRLWLCALVDPFLNLAAAFAIAVAPPDLAVVGIADLARTLPLARAILDLPSFRYSEGCGFQSLANHAPANWQSTKARGSHPISPYPHLTV